MSTHAEILSIREREVAGNLALGSTRKELSKKLYISPATAISHTKNIYAKTGSHNLADVTRIMVAKALGKSVKEIEEAIQKYIIDTANPLRAILMSCFLALQILIIYADCSDMRQAKTIRFEARAKRAKRVKKDTYYA